MARKMVMMDGNQAAAHVAHKINEVIAIYPITPSSPMGEHSDAWSAVGQKNIWGSVPSVIEMQSEGGAAASVHGALQSGALTTTFTASQGLLLMIPTLYKLAGELTSTCLHVSARSLACQALSIFGDHSDVMACRQTGVALLSSNSVQEAMDLALIGSASTLKARVPFIHFFDGFRTSHEIQKVEELTPEDMAAMIDDELVLEHRARGLTPDAPVIRGTSQNPDVYFQGRETVNKFYEATPAIVQDAMDKFAALTGRQYNLFDYVGAPDAERVIVMMGSGAEAAHEAVDSLVASGEKVGLIKVRLYRPFKAEALLAAIPATCTKIAVLDRQKEPGAPAEPLHGDLAFALREAGRNEIELVGGRYGLSSKEFTPASTKGVFENLAKDEPKNHFTVGIIDDVCNTHLEICPDFHTEQEGLYQAMFYGLGSDGTVGANKNTIKIIGSETENYAQGYFVYDSKKAGAVTVSHLRFGPKEIRSTYLIGQADFVACHQFSFLEKYDMLKNLRDGGTFLLNCPMDPADVWDAMPKTVQEQIIAKGVKFYAINAYEVANATGMGGRINTIMQTCFFHLCGILPAEEAVNKIKEAIKKTYGKKGDAIVTMNNAAVDGAVAGLVTINETAATSTIVKPALVSEKAPKFVQEVTAKIMAGEGDQLPVSKMPVDGTWPVGTTQWEKRNIALDIPCWDKDLCIQCGLCALACPHAVIRMKIYDPSALEGAPATFKSADAKTPAFAGKSCSIQVAVEDCTGCGACVHICPAKDKETEGRKAINMTTQAPLRETGKIDWEFFQTIPEADRNELKLNTVKGTQLAKPLFEFSGACAGCGETPYVKLLTQQFGDRLLIGNATGCSSIYGGNLPTTPYTTDDNGRGPAWNNSLFEDNAEFAFGFRLTTDKKIEFARELVTELSDTIGSELATAILANANKTEEAEVTAQRARIADAKAALAASSGPRVKHAVSVIDALVHKSIWAMGGDGWAYDIGYGGLDHVLASTKNINVIVMDTMVYSNTGGQASKSTPRGAVAKFAASGKDVPRKDLGMIAMSYGNIYVAQTAMGANPAQAVKAFAEADAYPGCSIVICYSHCIAHGINMT
ncbi:MAG: pyruvate:ferredoxin (flavodoxin) oxidoreductase, partial [Phycisphaerales bacterium]|nr:pyruvate:ferredoxin (flavodoxin) oxidoreductase [Phycisphaerales bacterium]